MLYRNMYWLLYILDPRCVLFLCTTNCQWRQHECNFGGDAEGITEQLQGIRKSLFLLDDNVGAIESVVSPCEVCVEPPKLGLKKIHAKMTIAVVNG